MYKDIATIPTLNLMLLVVPVLVVVVIYYRWKMNHRQIIYASWRMVVQLLAVGYVLNYLFLLDYAITTGLVFMVMLLASGWIALHPLKQKSFRSYAKITAAIAGGSLTALLFTTQLVLDLAPWFSVKQMIPLGGIAFSNAMNTVCLAAERFESEQIGGRGYEHARNIAFHAAMIPMVNMLLAVGLVSLPGVMTGQILSGVSPLIAVRYQMMILCLVLGAAGISTMIYLLLMRPAKPGIGQEGVD